MKPRPANVLPLDARMALAQAAQTPNTRADPRARQKAVETATQRIKQQYPDYFRQEQEQ